MSAQAELVSDVRGYDPGADEEMLRRAYAFSMEAHASQVRESGARALRMPSHGFISALLVHLLCCRDNCVKRQTYPGKRLRPTVKAVLCGAACGHL